MFYTVFIYESDSFTSQIIHRGEAIPYAEDLATYPEYFQVERKPTLEEAEVIFSVCKPQTLCAGYGKNAKTEKLA